MSIDITKFTARSRTVDIPELGTLTFREPTLADIQRASAEPYWWVACVTCADGSPLLADPEQAGQLRADIAGRLLEEVNRPRPTDEASAGSGASPHPSNA